MIPDDDAYRTIQKFRRREMLVGLVLALSGLISSSLYVIFLQHLGWMVLGAMIASDWLTLALVYFVIVTKMRKRPK